jgi:glycosyltransferase involved in cell wall biosynthesis
VRKSDETGMPSRCAALRASWGVSDDDLVLAYVGRLAPEKNLRAVCRAYEAVRVRHPRARLLLVGDGPLRESLQASCGQAIFAGQRQGEDLAAHYASADMFVFASRTETFGNVVTEAMASALPVVAHRHAAAGELIQPGVNGLLAAGADDEALVTETLALAASAPWRRAMGRAARETALRISWDSVVAGFETVTRPLIDPARGEERARWALARSDA